MILERGTLDRRLIYRRRFCDSFRCNQFHIGLRVWMIWRLVDSILVIRPILLSIALGDTGGRAFANAGGQKGVEWAQD